MLCGFERGWCWETVGGTLNPLMIRHAGCFFFKAFKFNPFHHFLWRSPLTYPFRLNLLLLSLLMFSGPHLWFVFLPFVLLINVLVQSQVCRSKRHVLLLKVKVTSTHSPRTLALTLTTLMLSQLLMQTVVTFSGPAVGVTGGYHSKKCLGETKKMDPFIAPSSASWVLISLGVVHHWVAENPAVFDFLQIIPSSRSDRLIDVNSRVPGCQGTKRKRHFFIGWDSTGNSMFFPVSEKMKGYRKLMETVALW